MSARALPEAWRDMPMPMVGDLALFLGGSDDSFTGDLLRLMRKADPGNRRVLAGAFPREDEALRKWEWLSDVSGGAPSMGQLRDALDDELVSRGGFDIGNGDAYGETYPPRENCPTCARFTSADPDDVRGHSAAELARYHGGAQ